MSEERDDVHGQERIGLRTSLHEPVDIMLEILIFVFLHHGTEPVAVVMQEDAEDCEPTHHIAFHAG